jgi:large subunit ribosomal protein L29
MKTSEMRAEDTAGLISEIKALLREQFNLRMQKATGQLAKPHRFREIRREIARLKTVRRERQGQA